MALSTELISQFVKVTRDKTDTKSETTVYGTIVEYNGEKYMQVDGSELLTPISSTTNVEDGERVTGTIKDHTLLVTGNLSSPSARTGDVDEVSSKINDVADEIKDFDVVLADKVDTKDLNATNGRIDNLVSDNVIIKEQLTAKNAEIDNLVSDNVLIRDTLTAQNAEIVNLKAKDVEIDGKLTAKDADIEDLQADNVLIRDTLTAQNAEIVNLKAKDVEITGKLTAQDVEIEGKLSAKDAEIQYANIDFANIDMAAVETLFAKSGIIDNLTAGDTTITGTLVGVTIKGDLIEAGTLKADRLVVKGSDGLFYKLNIEYGNITGTEQVPDDALHGSVIAAKTITAEKISVDDLVAFGATIGGFHITDHSVFSGVKESIDNTTRGTYMDDDGQFAFGDASNYVKFYKDQNGVYRLAIAAESLVFSSSGKNVENSIVDLEDEVSNTSNVTDTRLIDAESEIIKLRESISTLVRGSNGESLMTQTEDGWVFSLSSFTDQLNEASGDINDINASIDNVNTAIDTLNSMLSDIGVRTAYVNMSTENGQPSITLGKLDSPFKVVITNTDIRFKEDTATPAWISNQTLNIGKAEIREELKQGGFVWKTRPNGNYGLIWRGV